MHCLQSPLYLSCNNPISIQQRPMTRMSNRLNSFSDNNISQRLCDFHPRQDCCIPSCRPPSPKCTTSVYVERTKPIRPDRFYEPSTAAFNGLTTYKEHYQLKCGPRSQSYKPQSTHDPSRAKMDGTTSYREAYTPKEISPYTKPSWGNKAQFESSGAKMQGISTYRNDYNGCMGERVRSMKPVNQFDSPNAPMDGLTTYRTTYIPYCPREYQFAKQPLVKKESTGDFSSAPLNGISIYRADYLPKVTIKTQSLKPNARSAFPDAKFADRTTYRNDYNPFTFEKCVEQPCIPTETFKQNFSSGGIFDCPEDGALSTTHKVYGNVCSPPMCIPVRSSPFPQFGQAYPKQSTTYMYSAGDQNFNGAIPHYDTFGGNC